MTVVVGSAIRDDGAVGVRVDIDDGLADRVDRTSDVVVSKVSAGKRILNAYTRGACSACDRPDLRKVSCALLIRGNNVSICRDGRALAVTLFGNPEKSPVPATQKFR